MKSSKTPTPTLTPLPWSANAGGLTGEKLRSSTNHAIYFTDGFQYGWRAAGRNAAEERNAVRAALAAKYGF